MDAEECEGARLHRAFGEFVLERPSCFLLPFYRPTEESLFDFFQPNSAWAETAHF